MNLVEITKPLHAELIGQDRTFDKVSIDSRTIKLGDLFIAIKGPNFDGNDYIDAAIKQGAIAVISDKKLAIDVPYLKVTDTHKALFELSRYHLHQLHPRIVAITGSCGKTTTKALIASVLAEQANVLANVNSFNNDC